MKVGDIKNKFVRNLLIVGFLNGIFWIAVVLITFIIGIIQHSLN